MKLGSINRENIIRQLRFVFYILLSILFNVGLLVSRIAAGSSGNILGANSLDIDSQLTVSSSSSTKLSNLQSDINYYSTIGIQDKRVYILDSYFKANNSPMFGTAQIIVDKCEQYGAPRDCTIIAAIARNETDLCKYHNSAEMINCWGFGGGGIYRITFNSWEEAIDRVTSVLVQQYGNQYILNPSLMERTFCGDEPGCTNWGDKIKGFVRDIDNYGISIGMGSILSYR